MSRVVALDDSKTRRRKLVGLNIKLARHRADRMTQQELADRLGMRWHHVSDWETGKHEPSPQNLERLESVFSLRPGWFFQPHHAEDQAA